MQGNVCADTLREYSNFFVANADPLMHMFRNSGKDYNDFGRFQECVKVDAHLSMRYYLLAVLDRFPFPLTLGLCLPAECTMENVQSFKPHFVDALNSGALMMNIFEDVKGISNRTISPLTESDVRIVESAVENAKSNKFSAGSALVILIIVVFVGLAFIAIVINLFKESSEVRVPVTQNAGGLPLPEELAELERN